AEMPIDHVLWWPSEYYIIPLDDIHHVEVSCENFTSGQCLQIFWDGDEPELRVFTVNIMYAHRWVATLQWLGIPVRGAESVDVRTRRGLVNIYGWYLWFGLIVIGLIITMVITSRFSLWCMTAAVFIYCALLPIMSLFLAIWVNWRRPQ